MRRLINGQIEHDRRSQSGFTLIELLVVIAIIGLLISLLSPSLTGVRERSRGIACASGIRQVGMMLFIYAGDNDGGIFSSGSGALSVPERSRYWWNRQLYVNGYMTDANLFRCPFQPPSVPITHDNWDWWTYGARASWQTSPPHLEINFGMIPKPMEYWILGDSATDSATQFGYQTFRLFPDHIIHGNGFNYGTHGGFHLRHSDAANVFFADGSVRPQNRAGMRDLGVRAYYEKDLRRNSP